MYYLLYLSRSQQASPVLLENSQKPFLSESGGHGIMASEAAASEPIQHVLRVKDKTLWSFIHFLWIHYIMHFETLSKKI